MSPGLNFGRVSSFSKIYRSDALLHQRREIKFASPLGATPVKSLKVLECLYSDQVSEPLSCERRRCFCRYDKKYDRQSHV